MTNIKQIHPIPQSAMQTSEEPKCSEIPSLISKLHTEIVLAREAFESLSKKLAPVTVQIPESNSHGDKEREGTRTALGLSIFQQIEKIKNLTAAIVSQNERTEI